MKIIADQDIPFVEQYFKSYGELILKPGRSIQREDVLDADILLVRSVTKVDQALLHDTSVKFVGCSTTGSDHIDLSWLEKNNIRWGSAAGCNAQSVAEYVVCVIAALQKKELLKKEKCRAGVVGVGRVGARVVKMLEILGFEVVQCDPLRAETEKDFHSTDLKDFADLDLISLHTPLTKTGKYPTYHMIEKDFLARQKKDCVLLSAGRGSVVNFADLKTHGQHLIWCLDVWENEPLIDRDVMNAALIATPHIAGHSIQSDYRSIEMLYQVTLDKKIISEKNISRITYPTKTLSFNDKTVSWQDVVLKIYDPLVTTQEMKNILNADVKAFDKLRKDFSGWYEFEFVKVDGVGLNKRAQELLSVGKEKG